MDVNFSFPNANFPSNAHEQEKELSGWAEEGQS